MSNDDKKREQARLRQQRFRERNRTYQFSLPLVEAKAFEQHARSKGYEPYNYLQELILSDRFGTGYVVPENSQLRELGRSISAIGNNINQLTRHVNASQHISKYDVQGFQRGLTQLHELVRNTLTSPPNITHVLAEHLKRCPPDRKRLITWLRDY